MCVGGGGVWGGVGGWVSGGRLGVLSLCVLQCLHGMLVWVVTVLCVWMCASK